MQTVCPLLSVSDYLKGDQLDKLHTNRRPYIAVCASSWSLDEEMKMLFDALHIYDSTDVNSQIHVFITGKGPLRDKFIQQLAVCSFQRVKVFSVWLAYDDYVNLLGVADFGLSFHYSASGLDLPMKIVDYLGCGLATFSIKYEG